MRHALRYGRTAAAGLALVMSVHLAKCQRSSIPAVQRDGVQVIQHPNVQVIPHR